MNITLSYMVALGTVEIETPDNEPDTRFKPTIRFSSEAGFDLKDLETLFYNDLRNASGMFGHVFDINSTTNLDLSAAVSSLQLFDVESMKPPVIEAKELPEGELT